jgi:hypothetical protein
MPNSIKVIYLLYLANWSSDTYDNFMLYCKNQLKATYESMSSLSKSYC